MTYRRPFLRVLGPDGENMITAWGSKLIGVRLIDRLDGQVDEAIFRFTRKPPYMPIPGVDTPYVVYAGWSETGMAITGYYTFQRTHIFGEPKRGQELHLICRAGDLIDKLKAVDSQHFDKENGHTTLGDIFNTLFKSTGKKVTVHPDIASRPIPGAYELRWNESAMDFAMRLAEDHGGIVKPAGDGIIVLKAGSGESASGTPLPTIRIPFDENYGFDVEIEPRFDYAKVSASWLDIDKGTLEREDKTSRDKGASDALPHPFASKEAAKAAADAVSAEWAATRGRACSRRSVTRPLSRTPPCRAPGSAARSTKPSGRPRRSLTTSSRIPAGPRPSRFGRRCREVRRSFSFYMDGLS